MAMIAIFLALLSFTCIYEYRDAVFYPNGTQLVSKDWTVLDFTNPYDYEIYDVQIGRFFVPVVAPSVNVKLDPFFILPPTEFPIRINASLEKLETSYVARYIVTNNADKDLNITIKIPKFDGFISCENCVADGNITFSQLIPSRSSANFSILTTSSIPDGYVSFSMKENMNLSFGLSVPISIEKSHSGKWVARFFVSNPYDREMNVNATAWFSNSSVTQTLFTESRKLQPKENFSKTVEIESLDVPVFYLKARAEVLDICILEILPATNVDGSYLIGHSKLLGLSVPSEIEGVGGEGVGGEGVFIPTPTLPPTPLTPTTQTPLPPTPFIPEISIPPLTIYPEVTVPYAAFLSFAAIFAIISPIYKKRGIVVAEDMRDFIHLLPFKIYTPASSPLLFSIPVEPDEELVEIFKFDGLSQVDAESLAIAIKMKLPLLTSNLKLAKLALENGCHVVVIYGGS